MTIDKNQFFGIAQLNADGRIERMDDDYFNRYVKALQMFIGSYPAQEELLKTELSAADYINCKQSLTAVGGMLNKIQADSLAEECIKYADSLESGEHEANMAGITDLLAVISALSIDIQMAMYTENEQDEKAKTNAQKGKTDDRPGENSSILAVDDVTFFLNTLKSFLQDISCKLTCVNSGEAALRFLNRNDPDLFILDIEMPEMNGYELAQKIRAKGHKAPIIFLTGNASENDVIKAIKVGASDFIVKPINKKQLLERIAKFIDFRYL